MSATRNQPVTHDVGNRISWTLRPPVSKYKDNAAVKRQAMQDVCLNCHQQTFIDGHYYQYDALVKLYNEKFAKPATAIIKMVKAKKLLESKAAFSNDIEWEYWELWHHEGRRARMGAAMMGLTTPGGTVFTMLPIISTLSSCLRHVTTMIRKSMHILTTF
jgi:hypothetical protein